MNKLTALVTGANRGIGYELAKQLAEKGYTVYAGMRDPERSGDLAELARRDDLSITPVRLEVTNEKDVAEVAERIDREAGRLDLLVNNAASFAHDEEGVEQTRADEMLRVLAVNSVAPIIVTRHFLPLLERTAASGSLPKVATVSSGAALLRRELPEPGSQYSYHASKAALNVYLMRLAADLRPKGILSVGMAPGFVLTDMTRAADLSPTLLPPESAAGQISVLERLTLDDAGKFFLYTGEELDWFVG
jgi:NAD(P)-dependent dehydrogenase (short-subunit alcohol dehydrogenase family)